MLRLERIVGLGCLLVAVIFLMMTFDLTFLLNKAGSMGPGFFPRITSGLLIVISIFYIIQLFKENAEQREQTVNKTVILKQATLLLLLALCIYLTGIIGMLPSIGLFLFIILVIVEKMNWLKSLGFAILIIAIMYLLFESWLGVSLPKGLF